MYGVKKVVIYIAMSLDGYIADKNGSVGWLAGDGSDKDNPGSYPGFFNTVDDVVLGYTTYHQIVTELAPNNWSYAGRQTYVLTHRTLPNQPGITFVSEDVNVLLPRLKQGLGKTIWICGGADLVSQVLEARLADEITVSVMPILLGDGIKLFTPKDIGQKLKLISTQSFNGIVDLTYRP